MFVMFGVWAMEAIVLEYGWSFAVITFQLLAVMAVAGGYYSFLEQPAQQAVQLAFPIRLPSGTVFSKNGTAAALSPDRLVPEQLDGRVNLDLFNTSHIEPSPVVRGDAWVSFGKRISDILLSMMLIVFTLPLLIFVAITIKLTSPGPIFYRQTRVGLHGRHFEIFKFRSMTVDAERNGAQWAGTNDARVTAIGRIIRKTRIDEIPQALNILMGQMSFVGPRPERPQFTDMLASQIPHYDDRHRVKPGLTGWAQVNYPYGASVKDAVEKLRYDLYYLKNHSLLLDLFIILRTFAVALAGTGSR